MTGDPIAVDLRRMGGPAGLVTICAGESERVLLEDLRTKLGLDTPDLPQPGPGEEFVVDNRKPGPQPGATGEFPRGKVRADDEGGLRATAVVRDGSLFIDFGKPVAWLALGVADVEALIAQLQDKLAVMKKTGG
jgi:hypothetical protein